MQFVIKLRNCWRCVNNYICWSTVARYADNPHFSLLTLKLATPTVTVSLRAKLIECDAVGSESKYVNHDQTRPGQIRWFGSATIEFVVRSTIGLLTTATIMVQRVSVAKKPFRFEQNWSNAKQLETALKMWNDQTWPARSRWPWLTDAWKSLRSWRLIICLDNVWRSLVTYLYLITDMFHTRDTTLVYPLSTTTSTASTHRSF